MQNFLGTLSQFYDNATGLFGMPDISFPLWISWKY